jgi:hypothetical protein
MKKLVYKFAIFFIKMVVILAKIDKEDVKCKLAQTTYGYKITIAFKKR